MALVLSIVALGGLLLALTQIDGGLGALSAVMARARAWAYTGSTHYCPVCESYSSGFAPALGLPKRVCVNCFSWSRHRRDWLYIQQHRPSYGEDYVDRLRESGFDVTIEKFVDSFSDAEVERLGLHQSPRTARLLRLRQPETRRVFRGQ